VHNNNVVESEWMLYFIQYEPSNSRISQSLQMANILYNEEKLCYVIKVTTTNIRYSIWRHDILFIYFYFMVCCRLMVYIRGVQPYNTTGPNAHNQFGPWATAACVKLCGLDNSLATHGRLAMPFYNRNLSAGHKTSAPRPRVVHPWSVSQAQPNNTRAQKWLI